MFPQNLLKKVSEETSKIIKNIEQQLHDNFIDIVKMVLVVGGIFIFLIVILVLLVTRLSAPKVIKIKEEKKIESKYNEDFSKAKLLLSNEFEYPDIKMFDLTTDYVDFIPMRKYNIPDFKQSIKDYDIILEDSIKESLKFNFEK